MSRLFSGGSAGISFSVNFDVCKGDPGNDHRKEGNFKRIIELLQLAGLVDENLVCSDLLIVSVHPGIEGSPSEGKSVRGYFKKWARKALRSNCLYVVQIGGRTRRDSQANHDSTRISEIF